MLRDNEVILSYIWWQANGEVIQVMVSYKKTNNGLSLVNMCNVQSFTLEDLLCISSVIHQHLYICIMIDFITIYILQIEILKLKNIMQFFKKTHNQLMTELKISVTHCKSQPCRPPSFTKQCDVRNIIHFTCFLIIEIMCNFKSRNLL